MGFKGWVRGLAMGAGVSCVFAVTSSAEALIAERVVAVVGERPILLTDLRRRARPYLAQIIASSATPSQRAAQESDMLRELLNKMIDERLAEQAADKARLSVTSDEIDRGLKQKADQLALDVGDLLNEARRQGLVESEYRDEVRRQLLEGKLIQLRVMNRVRVSEDDAVHEYAQFVRQVGQVTEVRLLALQIPPGATSQQTAALMQTAQQVSTQAKAGTDFCALVQRHAQNPATKASCGASGPQPVSALLAPIASAIAGLSVMGVSDPIEFPNEAVVVAQLVKAPYTPTYQQVRHLMTGRAAEAAIDRQRKLWLQELRRGIYIDVRL